MGGAYSADGEGRGVCRVLVGKHEGKRTMGRPRHRWVDNIYGGSLGSGMSRVWTGLG
jgi:hypothetical protein